MRPYFMYLPFPLPLSIADKQRRGGQGVRFPALSRKTGANATVRPRLLRFSRCVKPFIP